MKFNAPGALRLAPTLKWQRSALTEKQAAFNHQNIYLRKEDQLYVECPWTALLDHVQSVFGVAGKNILTNYDAKEFIYKLININYFRKLISSKVSHTVCEHIRWMDLIELWKMLGVKNVHVSHLTGKNFSGHGGIIIHPWHLIAANMEHPNRNKGLVLKKTDDKKYLCSFVGSWERSHQTDIRSKLDKIKGSDNDVYFKSIEGKQFYKKMLHDNEIYNSPINNEEIEKIQNYIAHYNEILSDSIFSVCPEGSSPNTLRLWESMSIGSIPVLFESDWVKPPIEGFKWEDFSISIKRSDVDNTVEILREIPKKNIEKMKINSVNAYNSFRLKTCF